MKANQDTLRYLGFAFASADLLFEIDEDGRMPLVLGAARLVLGEEAEALSGRPWRTLLDPQDHTAAQTLVDGLSEAGRRGPLRCRLAAPVGGSARWATLSVCRLPQRPGVISAAIAVGGEPGADLDSRQAEGLLGRADFERSLSQLIGEARTGGAEVELAMVEIAGLKAAMARFTAPEAERASAALSDLLSAEALRGAATQLESERFALLRQRPLGPDTFPDRLGDLAREIEQNLTADVAVIETEACHHPAGLRALRFTLDQFVKEGLDDGLAPAAAFKTGLKETLRQAEAFSAAVRSQGFNLVFQPIVDLKTRSVHHYEALARFDHARSTFETIHLAEELDLIEAFDLTVIEKVVRTLQSEPAHVRIAVNVSGRSFLRPNFIDRVLDLTPSSRRLKDRLLFEITESAALVDLEAANARIQRLRSAGYCVCVDDFGSGAAGLAYISRLTVDIVKLDGGLLREIVDGGRDEVVLRHLAALCRDLKVQTIAEMIETEATAGILTRLGVDLGQGYLFGAGRRTITPRAPSKPSAQRPERSRGGAESRRALLKPGRTR